MGRCQLEGKEQVGGGGGGRGVGGGRRCLGASQTSINSNCEKRPAALKKRRSSEEGKALTKGRGE